MTVELSEYAGTVCTLWGGSGIPVVCIFTTTLTRGQRCTNIVTVACVPPTARLTHIESTQAQGKIILLPNPTIDLHQSSITHMYRFMSNNHTQTLVPTLHIFYYEYIQVY